MNLNNLLAGFIFGMGAMLGAELLVKVFHWSLCR